MFMLRNGLNLFLGQAAQANAVLKSNHNDLSFRQQQSAISDPPVEELTASNANENSPGTVPLLAGTTPPKATQSASKAFPDMSATSELVLDSDEALEVWSSSSC
jgi:hypothetical protein